MKTEKTSLRGAVVELAKSMQRNTTEQPPSADELIDYHADRLDPQEKEALQDRLVLFPGAARAAAEMARFPDIESKDREHPYTDEQIAEDWRGLVGKLREDGELPNTGKVVPMPRLESRAMPSRWPWLMAAASLVAAIATGLWSLSLSNQLADAQRLQPTELVMLSTGKVRTDSPATPQVTTAGTTVALDLSSLSEPEGARYLAELRDRTDKLIHTAEPSRWPSGTLAFFLPPNAVPPGTYTLTVLRIEDPTPTFATKFELEVVAAD